MKHGYSQEGHVSDNTSRTRVEDFLRFILFLFFFDACGTYLGYVLDMLKTNGERQT